MGCACKGRARERFLWYSQTNPEGLEPMIYNTEVEAKAKVMRKGGVYINYNPNLSVGQQIATHQAELAAAPS